MTCMDINKSDTLAVGCADKTIRVLPAKEKEEGFVRSQLKWRGISRKVTAVKWCPASECTTPLRLRQLLRE